MSKNEKSLVVQPGKDYACPVCGKIFGTNYDYGSVAFTVRCTGHFVACADGHIKVDMSTVKFPELIKVQEDIPWVLMPPNQEFVFGRWFSKFYQPA